MDNTNETGIKKYFRQQNIELSFKRICIDGLGGMALGLFASLLIGTILGTLGNYLPWSVLSDAGTYTKAVQGAAMAAAIGYAMQSPPFVLYSLLTVGYAANSLGGGGGPLAVYFVTIIAVFAGKLVSKRTPVDLILTPAVTIIVGIIAADIIAPPVGMLATALGEFIMLATEMQPFFMGIVISALVGIILTLPISSAAICAALGLVGLAGGAAVAGCCAHMVGFAVCSYRENKIGGLAAQGLGTSMLQVPNLMKKPVLWIPPVVASIVNGPIATCIFKLKMNGSPVSSGMGTSGLVGPIGVVTGWFSPSENALAKGEAAVQAGALEWLGLILVCVVIPVVVSLIVSELMRRKGIIKDGDYKLEL